MKVVRRPYIYWYDNELDSVERGLMNLAAAKVELAGELESVDDVSISYCHHHCHHHHHRRRRRRRRRHSHRRRRRHCRRRRRRHSSSSSLSSSSSSSSFVIVVVVVIIIIIVVVVVYYPLTSVLNKRLAYLHFRSMLSLPAQRGYRGSCWQLVDAPSMSVFLRHLQPWQLAVLDFIR